LNETSTTFLDAHRRGVRSEKLWHKIAIKVKTQKGDPPKFSDNPKYPPQNNLATNLRTPLDFQLL
jgi:hypothetical protein